MLHKFRFLSKLPAHRKFEFEPRYFDAEKEELESRVKLAEADSRADRMSIRAQYSMADKFESTRLNRKSYPRIQHQKNMATVRFLVVLSILLILTLYIFVKVL